MSNLKEKIIRLSSELAQLLAKATNDKELEALRLSFIGKKGSITELLSELKNLSLEEKKEMGPLIQALKQEADNAITTRKKELVAQQNISALKQLQHFDVTAYAPNKQAGHLHPYSLFITEIQNIFLSMGYEIWDGPELETEFNNFTALNIPADHPARDMYDTFWTDREGQLLRTHTSPVQVRMLQNRKPPLAGIAPGRTFRHEAVDASHDFMFMQCEGLLVDKNVTVAHLFATIQTFLRALFQKNSLDIRIRPGFFPFVEPGFEFDMRCVFCKSGCSVCKQSTWIEIFPGGLIHPNVLKACNIDASTYSGFAFGFGLTRLAMLHYGIDDVRLFHSGKLKFLEQF
ncbi:MAG: phenylalanine--tRNA ligase subunit alpha [Candidatus Babeliales bacterium]|jgi:phenylalanyl-tRNA synthetase alpha chain